MGTAQSRLRSEYSGKADRYRDKYRTLTEPLRRTLSDIRDARLRYVGYMKSTSIVPDDSCSWEPLFSSVKRNMDKLGSVIADLEADAACYLKETLAGCLDKTTTNSLNSAAVELLDEDVKYDRIKALVRHHVELGKTRTVVVKYLTCLLCIRLDLLCADVLSALRDPSAPTAYPFDFFMPENVPIDVARIKMLEMPNRMVMLEMYLEMYPVALLGERVDRFSRAIFYLSLENSGAAYVGERKKSNEPSPPKLPKSLA